MTSSQASRITSELIVRILFEKNDMTEMQVDKQQVVLKIIFY